MKQFIPLLLSFFLLMGCSKKSDTDPITYKSSILVNNSLTQGKWKLSSMKAGSVVQSLTPSQIAYVKHYTADFKFSDTDGLKGSWSMPSVDSLVEIITNFSSGVSVTQVYKITSITASQLNLNYTVNGTEINALYTATN
jgi:hypothetical protein